MYKNRIISFILIFGMLTSMALGTQLVASAAPNNQWSMVTPVANGDNLDDITYGNNTWVTIGYNGTILSSNDGSSWSAQYSGTTNNLYSITYNNNLFVAVGVNGTILTSTDGVSWTKQNSGTNTSLVGITYGNNMFVAVGSNGTILASGNGVTWTSQKTTYTNSLTRVLYANNMFVAVGVHGTIITSTDGMSWIKQFSNTDEWLVDIAYGDSMFVVVGDDGTILTSSNGTSWITRDSGLSSNPNVKPDDITGIAYGNNMFVTLGSFGSSLTSNDGIKWGNQSNGANGLWGTTHGLFAITYANNMFIAVGQGNRISLSRDGVLWIDQFSNTGLCSVASGNNKYIAVGEDNKVCMSTDGTSWPRQVCNITSGGLYDVAYGNGLFVSVGEHKKIATSSDGITWTSRIDPSTFPTLLGVTYGDNLFVAVGSADTVFTSSDGLSWVEQAAIKSDDDLSDNLDNGLSDVTYGNHIYVAVGSKGTILTSKNGVSWSAQASQINDDLYGVAFCNNRFIAVGDNGSILTSLDGTTWTKQNSGITKPLYGVACSKNQIVAVGQSGTILTSIEGVTWGAEFSGTSYNLRDVTYSNNKFIAVGDKGTIIQKLVQPAVKTAVPNSSTVLINGKSVPFQAYTIDQSNYFKLRDLAMALNGTGSQFDVGYDNATKAITITTKKSYTAVGGELTLTGSGESVIATESASEVYINGTEAALSAYTIGGNNYFKLRDVGTAIGFAVDWDGAANAIKITTVAQFDQAVKNKILNYADTFYIDEKKYEVYQTAVSSTYMGTIVFYDVAAKKVVTDTSTIDKLKVIWLVNAKSSDSSNQYLMKSVSNAFSGLCDDGSMIVFRYATATLLASQAGTFAGGTLASGNYSGYIKALQAKWTSMSKDDQMKNLNSICETAVLAGISGSFTSSQELFTSVLSSYNNSNLKTYDQAEKIYKNFVQANDLFNSAFMFEKEYLVDSGKLPKDVNDAAKKVMGIIIDSAVDSAGSVWKSSVKFDITDIKSYADDYEIIASLIADPDMFGIFLDVMKGMANSLNGNNEDNTKTSLSVMFDSTMQLLKYSGKYSKESIDKFSSNSKAWLQLLTTIANTIPPYLNYFTSTADSAVRYSKGNYDLYKLHSVTDSTGNTKFDGTMLLEAWHKQWNSEYDDSRYYAS